MKREKITLKNIVRKISKEEMEQEKNRMNMLEILGIPTYFDSSSNNDIKNKEKLFLSTSTLYKSLWEYNIDKSKASILINDNKPIPDDLYKKLVQTKKELEDAGILYEIL